MNKVEILEEHQKLEILAGAEKAFFEALLEGFAGGGKSNLPNVKVRKSKCFTKIVAKLDPYTVIDEWRTAPFARGDFAGSTTILHMGNLPVWQMSYCGFYPEVVIPFLKLVLASAYRGEKFFGGRGPRMEAGKFLYWNDFDFVVTGEPFRDFWGYERIFARQTGEELGSLRYVGRALI